MNTPPQDDFLCVDTINMPDFEARLEFWPRTRDLKCAMKGAADFAVLTTMKNLLKRVHEEATKRSVGSATFDVRDLKFMNSSCLKNFVWFLTVTGDIPADKRFHVNFIVRTGVQWQKSGLLGLQALAPTYVSIMNL